MNYFHIIIKGSLVAEPSMLTDADRLAGYFIRTKFEFEIKAYNKYEDVMFDERFMKAGPFKKEKNMKGIRIFRSLQIQTQKI